MRKFSIVLLLIYTSTIMVAQNAIPPKHFNLAKELALQGYDPVAYFTQNKAMKGSISFTAISDGVSYYFSSATNKELFTKNPKMYEPQYGGWCAYAMGSSGEKVEIDPETYKIANGKLYLFYHTWLNNTLTKWNSDESSLKVKADKNWQKIIQ